MGLNSFMKSQFIDVIEYVDENNKMLVYKFTRYKNEIKQGAKLIVRDGQTAVFVHKGQIADIFEPGIYKLNTGNLPILSSLAAIPYLFNSPIKSDVYFINTTHFINQRWGTKHPIIKRDPELGLIRATAFGTFSFRIADTWLFMKEVFGARKLDMTFEIIQYLTSMVGEAVAQCLGESETSILDLATHYRELSSVVSPFVNHKASLIGLEIAETVIENIGLPEEVEKMIDEQSGIGLVSKDMDTYVKYQSARAIRDAAQQPGGLAGIGAGLAVGNLISDNISQNIDKSQEAPQKDMAYVAEQLTKFKGLLDAGIITEDEFGKIKASLFNEIL